MLNPLAAVPHRSLDQISAGASLTSPWLGLVVGIGLVLVTTAYAIPSPLPRAFAAAFLLLLRHRSFRPHGGQTPHWP